MATERAYAHNWADFAAVLRPARLAALPAAPQTLAMYLILLETRRSRSPAVSALKVRPGAADAPTACRHAIEELETPTGHALLKKLLRRYSRTHGTAVHKKDALTIDRFPAIFYGDAGWFACLRIFDLRGHLTAKRLDAGDVAGVLSRRAAAAGPPRQLCWHLLERGLITNAAKKKVPIASIKRVTGQRSSGVVLDYVAEAMMDDDAPLLQICFANHA